MSFGVHSPQNQTGLMEVPPAPGTKMSGTFVTVYEREGAPSEQFELTQAQEDFAQKIARTGRWNEMPHDSGRRQIRQRVLDILKGAPASPVQTPQAAMQSASGKAKSKTDYVFVATKSGELLGVRTTKTEAKELAQSNAPADVDWVNGKTDSVGRVPGLSETYSVTRQTVPKPKRTR
jgi:hypothetical protein